MTANQFASIVAVFAMSPFGSRAEAAAKCPPGMTATEDDKGCAADRKTAASAGGSFDVLGNITDTRKKEINAKQAVATSKEDLLKSDFHKKYTNGYWDFFQASSSAKPGEYCTAMFMRQDMSVAILGPGGDYRGALMLFVPLTDNAEFPTSKQARHQSQARTGEGSRRHRQCFQLRHRRLGRGRRSHSPCRRSKPRCKGWTTNSTSASTTKASASVRSNGIPESRRAIR